MGRIKSCYVSGVSSLHYTGTVRQNICDYTKLLTDYPGDGEAKTWADAINKNLAELHDILLKIDELNNLE